MSQPNDGPICSGEMLVDAPFFDFDAPTRFSLREPASTPSHANNGGTPDRTLLENGDQSFPTELLGHPIYEILEPLGQGGMGVVYKARHRVMDRIVALKVIRSGLVGDPSLAARFRQEIRAAARLNHPNITHAYDAGEAGDLHFLVMEYVEGSNLDEIIAGQGRLPVALACEYARQTALGLQHAFECGMVHRDIKPHNLMLTPQGQVKILDFGLARFVSEMSSMSTGPGILPLGGKDEGRVTPPDAALGTVDYLAPEEALDARLADIRADIYSLGCTLYRMLTGQVLFPGGSFLDKLRRHVSELPPPLTGCQPEVPSCVREIIGRMLAKEPRGRYQTPAEVARELTSFAALPARHILVVDDNPSVRLNMAAILEKQGYAVSTVENGLEAITRLREGARPNLILLDLLMPVMNGIEFLQALRAVTALAEIPVVIVSGADQIQTGKLDVAAFLPKPVKVEELTEMVQRHTHGLKAENGELEVTTERSRATII